MKTHFSFVGLLGLGMLPAGATEIANSSAEFSQTQGNQGWYTGWRNYTADGSGDFEYNPNTSFMSFTASQWTGGGFALGGNPPWTSVDANGAHPNGTGSGAEHWVIRRWVAEELTAVTPVRLTLHLRKTNPNNGGATGALFQNGILKYNKAVEGADSTGYTDTFFLNVLPGDKIDFALTPVNFDGSRDDYSDGSAFTMTVDDELGAGPYQQPDGTEFIPASGADSDADQMPDFWEVNYSPGANLTTFTATGDYDSDGLPDRLEYTRTADPTKPDTDGDGLMDNVETKSGTYLSTADTGSDPTKPDTDGDGLGDAAEVNATPRTDPNLTDTDGDTFSDIDELFYGSNPTVITDTPLSMAVADSVTEFSGVQGQESWEYGYRNLTLSGVSANYDVNTAFLKFAGGSDNPEGWIEGVESTQHWNNGKWDLQNGPPWTEITPDGTHPNGMNNGDEHWTIRRWKATELTGPTPVTLYWLIRKANAAGDGVTGGVYLNGKILDTKTIAASETVGAVRRLFLVLKPTDVLDLVQTPTGVQEGSDGADSSVEWMRVDKRLTGSPVSVDGAYFAAPGAPDTDGDGLADGWEMHVTADNTADPPIAGELGILASSSADNDLDGLTNTQEQALGSNPLKEDTDGDGLTDAVETATGAFVSAANTGTSPVRADSDGDGLNDLQETAAVQLPSNPWLANSDADIYNDANELRRDADPGVTTEYVNGYPTGDLAHSAVDFGGSQGPLWFYGYRNLSVDGGAESYDPVADFIPVETQTNNAWDVGETNPPWTTLSLDSAHPNGPNNGDTHWAIRRIFADPELFPAAKPLAFWWHLRKQYVSGSDGASIGLYQNGVLVDEAAVTGLDVQGVTRIFYANVSPGDRMDLALRHNGPGQGIHEGNDGSDGSFTTLRVSDVIPENAVQPDGTPFPPLSTLQISNVTRNATTGAVTVTWPSETGSTYDVHYSTTMAAGSWTLLTPVAGLAGTGAAMTHTDNTAATALPRPTRIFYRVTER